MVYSWSKNVQNLLLFLFEYGTYAVEGPILLNFIVVKTIMVLFEHSSVPLPVNVSDLDGSPLMSDTDRC